MKNRLWDNPVGILVAIRDGHADDWLSLCKLCKCDPDVPGTDTMILARHIRSLTQLGLLTHTEDAVAKERDWYFAPKGKFSVTALVTDLQLGLKLSLKDVALLDSHFGMVFRPRFGRPSNTTEKIDIFVLMPFKESMRPIYDDHIKNVAKHLNLTVNRADDFFTERSVIEDIWNAINAARVIIADCTGRNPNVFYEIGMAHVIGKPVIPITQVPEDIPFDIEHLRYIRYEYTPRGMIEFEQTLAKALKQIQDEIED